MKIATRFGIAVMIVCLLMGMSAATEQTEDIEYVFPDDWSRNALVFAVENGIFSGDENHDLQPKKNITRAEMAAVLVRLIGATEKAELSAYQDVSANAWYYDELSAAAACGIFTGVSETMMQPGNAITREQAVVVLCRAFGIVSESRDAYKAFADHSKISQYARDSISAMRELGLANGYSDGTFGPNKYITRAEVAQLLYNIFDCIADSPEEIPEEGTVMYRGTEALPNVLHLNGNLVVGQAVSDEIIAEDWSISESLVLRVGKQMQVTLSGLSTKKLVCAPMSATVCASAQDEVYLWGNSCEYTGDANFVTVVGGDQIFNANAKQVIVRSGTLIHNGNAEQIELQTSTTLVMNGQVQEIAICGDYTTVSGSGKAAKIVVYCEYKDISLEHDELEDIWYENYLIEHDNALNVVQTQRIPCKVLYDTYLYTNFHMNETICKVPAGTIVYNEYHPRNDRMLVTTSDGKQGYINRWHCNLPYNMVTIDGSLDYSKATKEGFVDLMEYRSATQYLVWVSKYTQKVMVYEGEEGNWKLIKTFPCATGTNDTPTPAGVSQIFGHEERWYYSDYCINNVTYFNGEHAFHTVLMNYDGTFYDGTVGVPMSHGCVRMLPNDAIYMYNLPICTTVVVY